MHTPIRRLPDAELEVMQAVWACEPPAARSAIQAQLAPDKPMALTTLLTQLTRLAEKGFLTVKKQGRSNLYTPAVTQQAYLAAQGRRFFHQLCGGKVSTFAAALCDSGISEAELKELRELLEKGEL